jgi:hypothetical protein
MHIATTCPECLSRYQVDPSLRGQRMRCPNPSCRAIFVVAEARQASTPTTAGPAAPARHITGSVGDMVPVLSAEQVEPLPAPQHTPPYATVPAPESLPLVAAELVAPVDLPPEEVFTWDQPPPVREPAALATSDTPAEAQAAPPLASPRLPEPAAPVPPGLDDAELDFPGCAVVLGPGAWAPPPVRITGTAPASPAAAGSPAAPSTTAVAGTRKRRRALLVVGALFLVLTAGAVAAFVLFQEKVGATEDQRYEEALAELTGKNYSDAAYKLRNLEREYPTSLRRPDYQLLAELSETLDPLSGAQTDAEEAKRHVEQVRQLRERHKDNALLKEHGGEIPPALCRLADQLALVATERHDSATLAAAKEALTEAAQFAGLRLSSRDPSRPAREALARAEEQIGRWHFRKTLLDKLAGLVRQPRGNVVRNGRELVAEASRRQPDLQLATDREVHKVLSELPAIHRAGVKYTVVASSLPPPPPGAEVEASLLVVDRIVPGGDAAPLHGRVVLALARGVLHALDTGNGRIRWARRVGVDATGLPVRLPPTPLSPDRILVLSQDGKALLAVDADSGAARWRHPLAAPCPGRPVLVGDRILIPTSSGRVDEVEAAGGRLVGYYDLGEPLLGEGAHQAGTSLLYVPADSFSVFVLDVAQRSCAAVLYSEHPSGSLRGSPVVVSQATADAGPKGSSEGAQGYLILTQADSLESTRLRAFALPVAGPEQQPLRPEARLPGWSWFPPAHDAERLALATDAGQLAVYGLRQPGSRDTALFPIAAETLPPADKQSPAAGHALIAYAKGDHFWMLMHGALRQWQAPVFRATGPRLVPAWREAVALGAPLHEAQVQVDEDGQAVCVLVTKGQTEESCLVTAVEPHSAKVRWQTRLGLLCKPPLLAVGDKVLARDEGGGLYLFEAGQGDKLSAGFAAGGRALTPPGGPRTLLLFRGPDRSAFALAGSNQGTPATYMLRRLDLGDKPATAVKQITLPAPFVGTPGVGPGCLVFPLGNGILFRQPLAGGPAAAGPNWRARHADADAAGHVAWAGGQEYLVTDGSTALRRLSWPEDGTWEERTSVSLPQRIVAAPVVLATGQEGVGLRVAVADAGRTITVLEGPDLKVVRQWQLGGNITTGPFARAGIICCVLDHRRLVCLSLGSKEVHEHLAEADIVGQPDLVDKHLLVASVDGRFVAVNLETGKAEGPGYRLQADVAATAGPVPWGKDVLFAPLTDGTVLLLPLSRLSLRSE